MAAISPFPLQALHIGSTGAAKSGAVAVALRCRQRAVPDVDLNYGWGSDLLYLGLQILR